jgi:hypothetical protein
MRIHSDFIEEVDVRKAARLAGVQFTRFGLHGSRKREHAFDVILTGSSPRRQNQGEDYAATWDEWGSFLGYLFALDANAWTQQYTSGAHFDWATDGQYRNGVLPVRHASHRWEYAGGMASECQCGAVRRWASDFDGAAA